MPMRKTTKTQTTAYDVTKYLRTPEDMAAYLDAWLTDVPDDPAGIARALGDIARAAYSTRWRTRFQADGGQCSTAMADTVPR